jgi:hypothetical protein
MTTVTPASPSDRPQDGFDVQYCPQCARHRTIALRFCGACQFDFETSSPAARSGSAPPVPTVRAVPVLAGSADEPGPSARGKRWMLLGPIALL